MAATQVNVMSDPAGATLVKILTTHATQYTVVQQTVATKIFIVHTGESAQAMITIG